MPDPATSPDDDTFIQALIAIARGRADCGRPMSGEDARQLARRALTHRGISWSASPRGGSLLLGGTEPALPNA
jgi:hypothetical protein